MMKQMKHSRNLDELSGERRRGENALLNHPDWAVH